MILSYDGHLLGILPDWLISYLELGHWTSLPGLSIITHNVHHLLLPLTLVLMDIPLDRLSLTDLLGA